MRFDPGHSYAFGAVALSVLIACSPQPAATVTEPAPSPVSPQASPQAGPEPVGYSPVAGDPGYAGYWALSRADCPDTARTFLLTGETLHLTPQGRNCAVKSLAEDHPTGRSAVYTLQAACVVSSETASPGGEMDTITLTFGASDTVMQMTVNKAEPVTLERCPVPTP